MGDNERKHISFAVDGENLVEDDIEGYILVWSNGRELNTCIEGKDLKTICGLLKIAEIDVLRKAINCNINSY